MQMFKEIQAARPIQGSSHRENVKLDMFESKEQSFCPVQSINCDKRDVQLVEGQVNSTTDEAQNITHLSLMQSLDGNAVWSSNMN